MANICNSHQELFIWGIENNIQKAYADSMESGHNIKQVYMWSFFEKKYIVVKLTKMYKIMCQNTCDIYQSIYNQYKNIYIYYLEY